MTAMIEQFHVSPELTVEFLGTFARFEYTLKRAGYVEGDDTFVAASWERFGRDVAAMPPEAVARIVAGCPLPAGSRTEETRTSVGSPEILHRSLASVRAGRTHASSQHYAMLLNGQNPRLDQLSP